MKILDKYIAKTIINSIALITIMLSGLQIFILFVNQLDSIGKVNYGIWQVTLFVLLQMPYQVYLFFPMASLLGCLIGLGILANHSELVVMRAAGKSILQITGAVFRAAIIIILIITFLGETIVPKLAQVGNQLKMHALNETNALKTPKGIWIRYKNDFINVNNIQGNNVFKNVYQFRFNLDHQLIIARNINEILYDKGVWWAKGVEETEFNADHINIKHIENMRWDVALKPSIMALGRREADEMSIKELYQYLEAQKKIHQIPLNYKLAFWQRVTQPFTTLVMMLLAIPFIFGPLRSSTMGAKLLAGATVGFGFHILNRFFGPMSQVLQLPAVLAGIGPTLIFAILGIYLMRRVQ